MSKGDRTLKFAVHDKLPGPDSEDLSALVGRGEFEIDLVPLSIYVREPASPCLSWPKSNTTENSGTPG